MVSILWRWQFLAIRAELHSVPLSTCRLPSSWSKRKAKGQLKCCGNKCSWPATIEVPCPVHSCTIILSSLSCDGPRAFFETACSIYVQNSWKQTLREYQHSNVCMFAFTICTVCIYTDTRVKLECVMTCGMTYEKLNIKERKSTIQLTSTVLTHGHPSKHTNITLSINHIRALLNLHHSSRPARFCKTMALWM